MNNSFISQNKYRLAIIRSFGVTKAETEVFKKLKKFKLKFIGNYHAISNSPSVEYIKPEVVFPLGFDPVQLASGSGPSITSWLYLKDLNKYLQSVDIVNIPELWFFFAKQGAVLAKKLGKKLVVTVWETIPNHISYYLPPYRWNLKIVLKNADLFIAMTERARRYLKSLSVDDLRVRVIYPGVDLNRFYPRKQTYRSSNLPIRILFVGRLSKEKGIKELIRAFELLIKKKIVKNLLELWIVGSGEEASFVQAHSLKYPIKYLGYIPHSKLAEIYRKCNIFCLPSRDKIKWGIKLWEEQFGFVLIEAMASGLPIIGSNCGAIPEVIGRDNIIVQQGDVKDLLNSLIVLVKDRVKRVYMGKANRKRAQAKFDIDKQAKKLERALTEIL